MSSNNRRGLIVEGRHDILLYESLLRKLGYIPKVRQTHGNGNLIKKINAWVEFIRQYRCQKIIALKDLDTRSIEDLRSECSHFPVDVPLIVAIRSIEAWMLADEEALKRQFRNPRIRSSRNPEQIENPKKALRDIYRRHGKRYIAKREIPKIIEHIDLDVLRNKCSSFCEFEESLS